MAKIQSIETEILIIGGGAAGMAAANKLASAGVDVLIVERHTYLGGILPQCVHNGFGLGYYGKNLTGPEYSALQEEALRSTDVELMLDTNVLELRPDKMAIATNKDGIFQISFEQCILASGCREKPINSLPIAGTRPLNVYTAGETQEMINLGHQDIGDNIVILGSGDIGQIMARRYSILGKKVIAIIEQRSELGGTKRNREECIEAFNIPVILNSTITEIQGYPELSGVIVSHLDSGQSELLLCDTLVTALGLIPDTELVQPLINESADPSWLHFCGNTDYVHEIVDSVSFEAEALADRIIGAKGQAVRT